MQSEKKRKRWVSKLKCILNMMYVDADDWNVSIYTVNHKKTWHFIFDYNFG